jgi:hypothetical protein
MSAAATRHARTMGGRSSLGFRSHAKRAGYSGLGQ